ncbi:unnamed protein product [Prunus armeniaca]|uniref:Uncharacterized protein n=1 Tax=Prunus armeniaca TaxID=36596 RepID=A0A6J5XZC3_PRUAR|nr:unnamed protein product [Prunus armeniaca]CAB4317577.1 unnamed protein product [Prunus armeniaca]
MLLLPPPPRHRLPPTLAQPWLISSSLLNPIIYLLWTAQLRPFLIGHGLLKYVDGSTSAPAKTLIVSDSTVPAPKF